MGHSDHIGVPGDSQPPSSRAQEKERRRQSRIAAAESHLEAARQRSAMEDEVLADARDKAIKAINRSVRHNTINNSLFTVAYVLMILAAATILLDMWGVL